jgi:dephospho-CoA kinase
MAAPDSDHPYTVALTGGIASGKTLVSDEFSRLGVPVIDTDVIARQIVKPGQPALSEIKAVFGAEILSEDGHLKRKDLRTIIFADAGARGKLESILHPRIRQKVALKIAEVQSPYCILVIPLLAEHGAYPNIDRILVVDVESETQITRLMARDKSTRQQAEQALESQATRAQRLAIADEILENSGAPEVTRHAISNLNAKYLKLALKSV